MVYEYLTLPFVELEVRLGTFNGKKFDSSIDKKYFEKIKDVLETGEWKNIINIETSEHISDTLRLIKNKKTKDTLILKENILTKTEQIKSSPFDIRYSINQEFSLNSMVNTFNSEKIIRNKSSRSFISDTFKYELTIVNEKKNGINILKHEVELEVFVNKETLKWSDKYYFDFLEYKIYDLVNIVEPMDRDKFKTSILNYGPESIGSSGITKVNPSC